MSSAVANLFVTKTVYAVGSPGHRRRAATFAVFPFLCPGT